MKCNNVISGAILGRLIDYYNVNLSLPNNGKLIKTVSNQSEFKEINRQQQYITSFYIDIPRSYIFLTRNKNKNQCFLITENAVQFENHRFADVAYSNDILLEGYQTEDLFLVEDIIIHENHVLNTSIDRRLHILNDLLDHKYVYDPILSTSKIILMDYVSHNYIKDFWQNYRLKQSYSNAIRGLTLTPLSDNSNTKIRIPLK